MGNWYLEGIFTKMGRENSWRGEKSSGRKIIFRPLSWNSQKFLDKIFPYFFQFSRPVDLCSRCEALNSIIRDLSKLINRKMKDKWLAFRNGRYLHETPLCLLFVSLYFSFRSYNIFFYFFHPSLSFFFYSMLNYFTFVSTHSHFVYPTMTLIPSRIRLKTKKQTRKKEKSKTCRFWGWFFAFAVCVCDRIVSVVLIHRLNVLHELLHVW